MIWTWLRKRTLIREHEPLTKATKNKAIITNSICAKSINALQNTICRLSSDKDKMVYHISKCSKLDQMEYKTDGYILIYSIITTQS